MPKLPIAGQKLKVPAKPTRPVDTEAEPSTPTSVPPPGTTSGGAGGRPGVSDAATSPPKGAQPDGLDPGKASPRQSSGGGTLSSGESGSSGSGSIESTGGSTGTGAGTGTFPSAEPTGAHGDLAAAQANLARSAATVTEVGGPDTRSPSEVVGDALADARTGSPAAGFRESAKLGQGLAPSDDGSTGIAEQGTSAISSERTAGIGKVLDKAIDKGIDGAADAAKDVLHDAVDVALVPVDLVLDVAETAFDTGRLIRETADLVADVGVKGAADAIDQKHDDLGNGAHTPAPDTEGTGNGEFRFISEGLRERLGPKTGQDGGNIDPVDDGGVTSVAVAGSPVPGSSELLTGDDGRAGDVGETPGTSGFDGFGRHDGAIDPIDDAADPFGGGLEDDPLGGGDTGPGLDGAQSSSFGDDADDAEHPDEAGFSIHDPTLFGSPASSQLSAVSDLTTDLGGDDTEDDTP